MKSGRALDTETASLAAIAAGLKTEYIGVGANGWSESPFEWILSRPSRQRGKIGEQLVAGWSAARDLNVARSSDSDADRIIEGKRVEVKFSTLWANGSYVFQQIRDQRYDYLLCLGVSPFAAHAWIMRKSDIPFDKLRHQHGGARGNDTWWFSVKPGAEPAWLGAFGGSLADVLVVLKGLRKGKMV